MSSSVKSSLEKLKAKINRHLDRNAEVLLDEYFKSTQLLSHWLHFLGVTKADDEVAEELLDTILNLFVECAACLATGMASVSTVLIRAEIDIVLSWLYFRNHPVEWNRVVSEGKGFMLKGDVLRYLEESDRAFRERYRILERKRKRTILDPYRTLSAHVHRQAPDFAALSEISDVVVKMAQSREIVLLQAATSEFLSDILLAVFATEFTSLPRPIKANLSERLDETERRQWQNAPSNKPEETALERK